MTLTPRQKQRVWRLRFASVVILTSLVVIDPEDDALAGPASPEALPAEEAPDVRRARAAFVEGSTLVRKARWAEALAAFERSARLKPHPITTHNMAACLRAMGQYTRARELFVEVLNGSDDSAKERVPEALLADVRGYLSEIEGLLVHLTLTLDPPDTQIAVDGRPLKVTSSERPHQLVAGVEPPGSGRAPPAKTFEILLNPGAHVVSLTRSGYSTVMLNESLAPGSRFTRELVLDRLPAKIHIDANQSGALVHVNQEDLGPVPVAVLRPPGRYDVSVEREGYLPYHAQVTAQPGEVIELEARLAPRRPGIAEEWWFWTAIGVGLVGAAVTTYVVTRPEPERPPLDGGGLGWTLEL